VHPNRVEVNTVVVESKEILAGLSAFIVLLLVGAIFRRLHVSANEQNGLDKIGDRVACGLLAVPLICVLVRTAFPKEDPFWALMAPLPVVLYTGLLTGVDANSRIIKNNFTKILFGTLVVLYLIGAAYFVGTHT
jgi:hypothetical protein